MVRWIMLVLCMLGPMGANMGITGMIGELGQFFCLFLPD